VAPPSAADRSEGLPLASQLLAAGRRAPMSGFVAE